jgi:hypothetical protein
MFNEFLTEENRVAVRNAATASTNPTLDQISEDLGVPEAVVAMLLDADMCMILPPSAFENVWSAMVQWEKATFITATPGAIIEIKGRLPKGEFGHGYFNIGEQDNPLSGHIQVDAIAAVCLVSKPFMGLESHSVRFYNKTGALMFAVYVGRNGKTLIPSVKESFMKLRGLADQEAAV